MTDRDLLLDRVHLLLRSVGRAKEALEVARYEEMPWPADPVTTFRDEMVRSGSRSLRRA